MQRQHRLAAGRTRIAQRVHVKGQSGSERQPDQRDQDKQYVRFPVSLVVHSMHQTALIPDNPKIGCR